MAVKRLRRSALSTTFTRSPSNAEKRKRRVEKDVDRIDAGEPDNQRVQCKKCRPFAEKSGRRPCRSPAIAINAKSVARSTYRQISKPVPDHQRQLHQRIVTLPWVCPRYGYRPIRRLMVLLKLSIRRIEEDFPALAKSYAGIKSLKADIRETIRQMLSRWETLNSPALEMQPINYNWCPEKNRSIRSIPKGPS